MNQRMDNIQIDELLKKYRLGTCSNQEKAVLESWYLQQIANDAEPLAKIDFQHQHDALWESIVKAIPKPAPAKIVLWPRLVAAVMAIAIMGTALFHYRMRIADANKKVVMRYAESIMPGRNSATLTLASGRTIRLGEAMQGELAREAGVIVTKAKDGQLIYEVKAGAVAGDQKNTLSTARGETYQVLLPDGTRVYLNAASTLSYPASFIAKKQRLVELRGEGYFEVAKDKSRPFIVHTAQQQVEVLGTHFNISSYAAEPGVKTTLLEGSVALLPLRSDGILAAGRKEVILKPGQQAVLNKTGRIVVREVEAEDAIDWKSGYFMFNSEPLESIMNRLGRWYNVDVEYQDETLKKETFFGKVGRYENIGKALNLLSGTDVVQFYVEGKKIIVRRKD